MEETPAAGPATEFNALQALRRGSAFVRQHRRLLILGPVVGLGLGLLAQLLMPTVYEAKGTFMVDDLPFGQAAKGDAETERTLVQTLILSIPNGDMLQAITDRTNSQGKISFTDIDRPVSLSGSRPAANISVEARRNSRIGIIEAKSQDPQFAAGVTNALLEELLRYNRIGGKVNSVTLRLNFSKAKADSLLRQLIDLSAERIKIEQQNSELNDYVRRGFPLEGFPAFNTDVTLNNLKTQLILTQSQYDSVASSSTRGDQLSGRRSELQGLRGQLSAQSSSLAGALRSQFEITRTQEENVERELKATQEQIQQLEQRNAHLVQSFGDPALFKELANNDVDNSSSDIDSSSSVIVIIDRAHLPKHPVSPKLWLNLLLGLFLGGAVGTGIALAISWVDSRLVSFESAERLTNIPCLAMLPALHAPGRGGSQKDSGDHALGLGFLRARLLRNPFDIPHTRVIGFTPSEEGTDCSKLVANLAIVLARADRKVLVVDLHLTSPRQAQLLQSKPAQGLGEWMSAGGPIAPYIAPTEYADIGLLSPVHMPASHVEKLLASHPLAPGLLDLIGKWDFVLIDSPAVIGNWNLLSALPFGSPLVIGAEYAAPAENVQRITRHAQSSKWDPIGLVIQNCPAEVVKAQLG